MKESQPYAFGRIGGALCLDFTNTASWSAARRTAEHLHVFGDLIRWCREGGIISPEAVLVLSEDAEQNPAEATAILTEAKKLRETLYRIFIAVCRRKYPARSDLHFLNETLEKAPVHIEVQRRHKVFCCKRKPGGSGVAKLLGPVAWSAAELLTAANREQIKCCASETCGWLFLDTTKNHSRRWCDMADCGSKAKAKRYYHRKTTEVLGTSAGAGVSGGMHPFFEEK